MNTIKKFIHYYGPYKTVFFIDLICAAVISLIDLAYPQILRTMTKTLFTQDQSRILHALPVIAGGLFLMYVIQCLCKYYVTCQGHMMGANMERICGRNYLIITSSFHFPITVRIIPVR